MGNVSLSILVKRAKRDKEMLSVFPDNEIVQKHLEKTKNEIFEYIMNLDKTDILEGL